MPQIRTPAGIGPADAMKEVAMQHHRSLLPIMVTLIVKIKIIVRRR
jgi:hypothetical protein